MYLAVLSMEHGGTSAPEEVHAVDAVQQAVQEQVRRLHVRLAVACSQKVC